MALGRTERHRSIAGRAASANRVVRQPRPHRAWLVWRATHWIVLGRARPLSPSRYIRWKGAIAYHGFDALRFSCDASAPR